MKLLKNIKNLSLPLIMTCRWGMIINIGGLLFFNSSLQAQDPLPPGAGGNVVADSVSLTEANLILIGGPAESFDSFTADPLDLIKGRIPGVYVADFSGQPGEPAFINIRGLNTLYYNHEPLILMDGIPVLNTLDINIEDIESIRILKDAASLSAYGSRAANGVILIDTKKGLTGENKVTFRSSFGLSRVPQMLELLNGQQAFELMQELNRPFEGTEEDKSIYWGNGEFESGSFINSSDLKDNDWQDRLFRTGHYQDYNLAFSGGSENTRFRVSGSYLKNEGIVKPSDYSRMGISFNIDRKMRERIHISSGLRFMDSRQTMVNTNSSAEEGGVIMSALATPPFLPVTDASGGFFINPLRPQINNVDANIAGTDHSFDRNAILGNLKLRYSILDQLTLEVAGSANVSMNREKLFLSTEHVYFGRDTSGFAMFDATETVLWNSKAFLKYNKSSGLHDISLNAGGEISGARNSWNHSEGTGFANDQIKLVGTAANKISYSNLHTYRLYSLLATINYSFSNKYFLDVNFRADATGRFSHSVNVESDPIRPDVWDINKDPQWGFSEGLSFAWKISEEAFLENAEAVSDLTLKTSYGVTGNDGGYRTGRIYPYYWNASGYNFNPDEDFTERLFPKVGFDIYNLQTNFWEKTTEYSAGLNLGLFDNRLRTGINYFNRLNSDLLLPDSDTSYANMGEITRTGIEFWISSRNLSSGSFLWQTDVNLTNMSSEVTSTGPEHSFFEIGFNGNSNVIMEEQAVYAFYGYETDGIFQNQSEVANHAFQEGAAPGDIRYADQNGDNVIDENDRVVMGDPNPDMIIALNNILTYRNFDFSFMFTAIMGQDILNLTRMQTEGLNDWINHADIGRKRWTSSGSATDVPRAAIGTGNDLISDRFVEDGSFVRLKNISLAYNVPSSLLNRVKIESVKIYVQAQNLLTFTDYSGYDPEVSIMGPLNIDYGAYPNARYVGGGISIGF